MMTTLYCSQLESIRFYASPEMTIYVLFSANQKDILGSIREEGQICQTVFTLF